MLRHRKILLIGTVLLVAGSLSTTLGYALHLHSDGYRRSLEARLAARLNMPLTIGSVEPLSLSSRRLHDVRVRSPRRDTDVFACDRAVWRRESDGGTATYALDLVHGWLVVGTRAWDRDDYRRMLQTGLGHDFAAMGIRRIRLTDLDLQWKYPHGQLSAGHTTGSIRFDDDGVGRAVLEAPRVNGVEVPTPISITAQFTPGSDLRFHEVVLDVPDAPLSALNLDTFLGATVTQGHFAGTVRYRERERGPVVSISGGVADALLHEWTAALPGGPYDGRLDVMVDEAVLDASTLQRLRFGGEMHNLDLEQWTQWMGRPLSGRLSLRIHQATYEDGRVPYFSGEGQAVDVPLGPLTELIGQGRITGKLNATIHSLLVVEDQLILADVTLDAVPDENEPGTIDRAMLRTASLRTLGFDATRLLPPGVQQIEYTRLGVRLELNRSELRVFGTHGDEGTTILTVTLLGREIGILKAPQRTFHVDDLVTLVRRQLDAHGVEEFRRWLTGRDEPTAPNDPNPQ